MNVRLAASAGEAPMPLGVPPSARTLILTTPPSIAVGPVYVFAAESVNVPAIVLVRPTAPASVALTAAT